LGIESLGAIRGDDGPEALDERRVGGDGAGDRDGEA
jgi:hypothetical protein